MNKSILTMLYCLLFLSLCSAQQKPYGYKLPFNGEFMSTAFIIQDGFVLDSAVYSQGLNDKITYGFKYNEQGKLKRDINFIRNVIRLFDSTTGRFISKNIFAYRDYFYNGNGYIDSVAYTWIDSGGVSPFRSKKINYSMDGKIISEIYSNNGIVFNFIENNYDSVGNLLLTLQGNGGEGYGIWDTTYNFLEYDIINRLTSKKTIIPWPLFNINQTFYQYDSFGNPSWYTRHINENNDTTDGPIYYIRFDETGKASYSWNYNDDFLFKYDAYNRLINIGSIAPITQFHYNADGNLDSLENLHSTLSIFSGPTLVDSYGNALAIPKDAPWYNFYYSPLSTTPPTEPTMRIPCSSLNFGNIKKDSSKSISFQVTNTSLNPLVIDSIYTLTGNFAPQTENAVVNQGTPLTLTVQLTPDTIGFYSDTLYLKNNSAKPLIKIPVSGKSPFPQLRVSPASLEFGQVKKDSLYQNQIALMDSSVNTLQIDSIYTVTKYFNLINSLTSNMIALTDTAYLTIGFAPDSAGSFFDTLFIISNSPVSLKRVPLTGNALITSVQKNDEIPHSYALNQNYPNPFNPTTTIRYELPKVSFVTLTVYDILGRKVATLVNEIKNPGIYSQVFDASHVSSGIFFYRVNAGNYSSVKKMLILK